MKRTKKALCVLLGAVMCCSSAALLTGCGADEIGKNGEVNIYNWGDYIAEGQYGLMNVIDEFEKETLIKVNYTTYDTNEEMYNKLKNSNDNYDVVVPSEYMISKLLREKLLQKINYDNVPNYKYINKRFKNLPCDPDNQYTVCCTWGVTALVYDKTKVKSKPADWNALWDKNLSGNILMINNSRDAMAIAMQTLGINPAEGFTKADVDKATKKLKEQKPLIKKYVMDQVFTEMEGGQAAIAPYYAGDIAMMMEENDDLDYVLPKNGSNLFFDAFCIPASSKNKENAEKFINFMEKPEIAAENCKYLRYGCPNDEAVKLLPEDIKNSELTFPSDEYLNKCYIFSDVGDDIYAYMQEQFVNIQAE